MPWLLEAMVMTTIPVTESLTGFAPKIAVNVVRETSTLRGDTVEDSMLR